MKKGARIMKSDAGIQAVGMACQIAHEHAVGFTLQRRHGDERRLWALVAEVTCNLQTRQIAFGERMELAPRWATAPKVLCFGGRELGGRKLVLEASFWARHTS